MLIIGLTGSIATGKSTVSSLLSSPPYSLPIIDADQLARKVVEPGTPGYAAIVNYFGPSTPDLLLPPSPDTSPSSSSAAASSTNADPGTKPPRGLNRPALGRRVFGTTEERKRDRMILNKIVHPAVRWEVYKSLLYYYVRGYWAVVLDVPLLFESGMDLICGTVVVVGVKDPAVQMGRLRARDAHLTAEDAENRVRSQGDVRGKVEKAEFRGRESGRGVIVWNDGDREELEREVRKAVETIRGCSPWWWAWGLLLAPPLGVGVAAWNLAVNYGIRRRWERKEAGEKARL
ncbi:P-loop containing nucleoside triphosphate hydrolase protein [Aspergillus varians]